MDIIPVIDLLHGQVVRAQRGERHLYQPIQSGLCSGSKPQDIVGALLGLYPFTSLYIADLDAIQGHGNHFATIAALRAHYPQLKILLDAGFRQPDELNLWRTLDLDIVIGSESMASMDQYRRFVETIAPAQWLLSLDFGKQGFLGAKDILDDASSWPMRIIAMSLFRVGSLQGPDHACLSDLIARAGKRKIIAAGGVRHMEDLDQLKQLGVAGALVASALHDGHINPDHLD